MEKITPKRRLFWFLKEGVSLDLAGPSQLELYVQQVITRGGTEDVKGLLKIVGLDRLKAVLRNLWRFL